MRLGVLDTGHPRWAIELAPHVEHLGYSRYWLAEHHGHPAQSGSPEVLTGIIAAITDTIRVGPAGVLLRYYSPYKVAQSFRLLDGLFRPRIDLGVARGAGGDDAVSAALLDGRTATLSEYEAKVGSLAELLRVPSASGRPNPLPTFGDDVPLGEFWVLGATRRTALLAARLGAAFGFSEYFARMADPEVDTAAIVRAYRTAFQPGPALRAPRWNVAITGVATARPDSGIRIAPIAGPPPLIGSVGQWRSRLRDTAERYETDEVIVLDLCDQIADRRRSYDLMAEAADLAVRA
ncbi:MAG: MsnO8 family LLM class oxidoreductase [Gemmatimonadetes bacterium]|nr:MsnO8 family LLM class oxidoreductase [Gemmatimonadota bacterium]